MIGSGSGIKTIKKSEWQFENSKLDKKKYGT